MKSPAPGSVEEYISAFPEEIREILQNIRAIVRKEASEAEEAISYGMPTFKLHGNLVHFAAYKNHIGFYPTPTGTEAFKKELSVYKSGKGSIQFPLDHPMPYDLITEIVRFRVLENQQKPAAKKKKK